MDYNRGMIIYCCVDLIFSTKIRSTAEHLGVPARPAHNTQMLCDRLEQVDDDRLNDPVTAVLIDLELGNLALDMIKQVKGHDPSIPVATFGSHVETSVLQTAHKHGADTVMARSQFVDQLPKMIRQYSQSKI